MTVVQDVLACGINDMLQLLADYIVLCSTRRLSRN